MTRIQHAVEKLKKLLNDNRDVFIAAIVCTNCDKVFDSASPEDSCVKCGQRYRPKENDENCPKCGSPDYVTHCPGCDADDPYYLEDFISSWDANFDYDEFDRQALIIARINKFCSEQLAKAKARAEQKIFE